MNSTSDSNRGFPQALTEPIPVTGTLDDTRDFALAESQARSALDKDLQARYENVQPLGEGKHVNANGPDAPFLTTDVQGDQGVVVGSVKDYGRISASDISEAAHTSDMMNAHSMAAAQDSDLIFNVDQPMHQPETFATYNPLDPSAPDGYMVDTLDAAEISGAAEASAREYAGSDHYVAMTTNAPMSARSADSLSERNIAYTHVTEPEMDVQPPTPSNTPAPNGTDGQPDAVPLPPSTLPVESQSSTETAETSPQGATSAEEATDAIVTPASADLHDGSSPALPTEMADSDPAIVEAFQPVENSDNASENVNSSEETVSTTSSSESASAEGSSSSTIEAEAGGGTDAAIDGDCFAPAEGGASFGAGGGGGFAGGSAC
jgi:hypothetical protein